MQVLETKKTEDGKSLVFSCEASADEFKQAVLKVYRREVKNIAIPGFRKGKAPLNVLERMYGKEVFYEDAINDLLPVLYEAALSSTEEKVVGYPKVEVVSADEEGLKVDFTTELRPQISVPEYKGISAHKHAANVTESQIEAELNRLQERNSATVKVEDRAAEMGDIATIYFKGYVDGKAFEGGEGDDYPLELGSNSFIPGFEEQIVGHNTGDEFDIDVTFPEAYDESLAGKPAVFHIIIRDLQNKVLPELDDEFAKDVSEFDTLEELKADILRDLTEKAEATNKEAFENALMDKIVEGITDDIGSAIVDEFVESNYNDLVNNLSYNGLTIEAYCQYTNMNPDELKIQMRPAAEKQAKVRLALEAIAKAEGIEVTEEEIEAECQRLADQYSMEIEKVKELVDVNTMKEQLACNKALDLVAQYGIAEECDDDDCDCDDCNCEDCDHDCDHCDEHCDCCDHE